MASEPRDFVSRLKEEGCEGLYYIEIDQNGSSDGLDRLLLYLCALNNDSIVNSNEDTSFPPRYDSLRSIIKRLCAHAESKTLFAVVEEHYVERIFRDSFYRQYSTQHFMAERDCQRIFFFDGGVLEGKTDEAEMKPLLIMLSKFKQDELQSHFLGFVVINPLELGNISRSILTPKSMMENTDNTTMVRVTKYGCSMKGVCLIIKGFPYMQQDGECFTCAEVTLLLLADYFSHSYPSYHTALPSDINRVVDGLIHERAMPSHGLSFSVLTHVLKTFGFLPRLYTPAQVKEQLLFILHCYVDSNIPVAVGIAGIRDGQPGHAMVCIGHGKRQPELMKPHYVLDSSQKDNTNILYLTEAAEAYEEYIMMDDGNLPYAQYTITSESHRAAGSLSRTLTLVLNIDEKKRRIANLSVPLNKRMSLEALDALTIFKALLADRFTGILNVVRKDKSQFIDPELLGADESRPLVIRVFISTAGTLRSARVSSVCQSLKPVYGDLPLPHFVWVCELSTFADFAGRKKQIVGELLLDSTAAKRSVYASVILIHYPGFYIARQPGESPDKLFESKPFKRVDDWTPFEPLAFQSAERFP